MDKDTEGLLLSLINFVLRYTETRGKKRFAEENKVLIEELLETVKELARRIDKIP